MRQEPLAHGCEPSLQERLAVLHEVTNELTTDVFWITDWINFSFPGQAPRLPQLEATKHFTMESHNEGPHDMLALWRRDRA